jgi:hypothetical protein
MIMMDDGLVVSSMACCRDKRTVVVIGLKKVIGVK